MANKRRPGRPSKLPTINLAEVERLGALGATDDGISARLGVSHSTLENWKKKNPEFLDALKRGKESADMNVVSALYRLAVGERLVRETDKEGKVLKTRTEYAEPDATACIFWLKNRKKDDWKDRKGVELENPAGADGTPRPILLKIVHTRG